MRENDQSMERSGLILGIESSCDETAAAVVRAGGEALSNIVASQMNLHANYGGVVPELASREHLRNVVPVVRAAMEQAGISFEDLDAIAVTEGPGLAGALLVGITYAKALSFGVGKPLIGVNHLEGHIHAVLMEARQHGTTPMELPLLALVVSGGHTHLYLANMGEEGAWRYRNVGRTVDDAAGEAYDKVAKLLGLGYPGGPWIDTLAQRGNPHAVPFRFGRIKPRVHRDGSAQPSEAEENFDFSFSGIKTAVLRYIETHGMREGVDARRRTLAEHPEWGLRSEEAAALCDSETLDLIASFQYAVVGNLLRQTFAAAEVFGAKGIVVSGGVAANSELRRRFQSEADKRGLPVAFPSLALSTDNAAMIAAAAWPKFAAGKFAPDTLGATPQLRLG
jgi:N6-L-threonylcarbamoyladenine synthase